MATNILIRLDCPFIVLKAQRLIKMAYNYETKKGSDYSWLKSIARDIQTINRLNSIQRLEGLVKRGVPYSGDNPVFMLQLGNHNLWLRESDAWAAMVLYTEIFRERDHAALPGFDGRNSDCIVDLGANIGVYTLKIKENNPACKILCVEPDPAMYSLLQRNIDANKIQETTLVNLAVAENNGEISLGTIPECGGITGKYLGVIKANSRGWIDPKRIKTIQVRAKSLTSLVQDYSLSYIDILKMDVEGMELEVLKGASPILGKIDKIVLEWHEEGSKNELTRFLKENDFNLLYQEPRAYGNIYFRKKS